MPQKITLQAVAAQAKVSLATASRVVNKTGRVSPDLERRVRTALLKLGATAQPSARTHTLCFLLANRPMLHPFHAQVLMGAHAFAAERSNHILFYPFDYRPDTAPGDIQLPTLFRERRLVDGYILGGLNSPNLLQLFKESGVPLAVLGDNVRGPWASGEFDVVWMDHVGGTYELTKYLQGLGHRNICVLGNRHLPTARYMQGYEQAMREAGLTAQVVEGDSQNERETGYILTKTLLSQKRGLTALMAQTDTIAHGAFDAIWDFGLRIPEDISVAGFGDRPEAVALNPALTSVAGYPDQVGRRLAEFVLRRIDEPGIKPQSVTLPTRLIKRESCGTVTGPREAAPPGGEFPDPKKLAEQT